MNLYNVRVNDYSLPGFVSGDINYYGTKQTIMDLLKNGEDHRTDLIEAAEEYFSGKGPGKVSLFGEEPRPLINPVKLIGEATYIRNNFNYKFLNTWDCETDINIEHMEAALIYIVDHDGKYKRCIQATVKNATYKSDINGEKKYIDNSLIGFWGYPGFITLKKEENERFILQNTIYYMDTIFKNKGQIRKDMKHPHKPYLSQFFFGIYGDD